MPRTTTGVSRRHGPLVAELGFSSRFVSGPIQPAPAVATVPPRPLGDLTAAPTDQLVELAQTCWDGGRDTIRARRRAMQAALSYLGRFDGDTWQQRWDASPIGRGDLSCHDLDGDWPANTGFRALFCFRTVRPSLLALRRCTLHAYAPFFVAVQQDPLLEKFAAHVAAQDVKFQYRRQALLDIASLLTVQGVALSDVTPPALLHFAHENRQVFAVLLPGAKKSDQFIGQLAWRVLCEMGQFPTGTPPTIRAVSVRADGKPRRNFIDIVIAVRSFYYDLHTWAAEEPARWGPWVAPCPVSPREMKGGGERRRRINERTADRTRQRQPLLPVLVRHVEDRYDQARSLLERTRGVGVDEAFVHEGRTWRRIVTPTDLKKHGNRADQVPVRVLDVAAGRVPVRVLDVAAGRVVPIERDEEDAFWDWAAIETLRHTGVRIEELCELTHLSVRQYQRSNGEVIALLVIAPSKTDRERVIPMSVELFHVIASVIRRHTRTAEAIPPVNRFDPHEKVWSAPLPFLFQRRRGTGRSAIGAATILHRLKRLGAELADRHPAFATIEFTPHDFRRIFTTELVNSGLPIHIGAALLGHLNIQTTRGYVAVFNEDVVRHYVDLLDQRRQQRPADEYPQPTPDEWEEFDEHFDKRKVELGACGRPYGTPCQHEHACIRCPMLHVNPRMLGRLDELEADLLARRQRAESESWTGEVEGIDLTLTFLRTKRQGTQRRIRRPASGLTIQGLSDTSWPQENQ